MQTINALLESDDFEQIIAWVPVLYRSNVRYDIRVNLALLKVADALYLEQEYDSALPLYRMIVPRDELIAYQEKNIQRLKIEAGLPPLLGQELTEDEKLIFGSNDADEKKSRNASSSGALVRVGTDDDSASNTGNFEIPRDVEVFETLLSQLKDEMVIPPYENFVNMEMALLYKSVHRYWEAVRFFDAVYAADPDGEVGQRCVYEAVELLSGALADREDAERRAFDFLNAHKSGTFPRLIAYMLTRFYQEDKDWRSLLDLRPYIDSFEESYDAETRRYDSELYFMQAVGELMLQHYTNAVEGFQKLTDDFQGTPQEPNGLYWCGFSYLCLDQHEKAYECFDRYTRDFPGGAMLDEAYYQGGIALFGQDKLDEAVERFTYVIDQYGPQSPVYSDACNMRGDIRGAQGGDFLDLAVTDYTNAYNAAIREGQATYAIFGACEIYKADRDHYGSSYIEKAVNDYKARWGLRGGDLAKAMLWLGRVKIQDGDYAGAVRDYKRAILDYGSVLRQDGVDQIIPEFVKLALVYLPSEQQESIKTELAMISEDSQTNPTLKLRLRVTLAKFDKSESQLGVQLLNELEDLEVAPPPVIDLIAKAALEEGKYERSEEILRLFKNNFEDSPYVISAYRLRVTALLAENDLDEALATVIETQELFGTIREVAWAQLIKAKILLAQAVLFDGNTPLSQDVLDNEAQRQLLVAQDKLKAVVEKIAELESDEDAAAAMEQQEDQKAKLEALIVQLSQAVQGVFGEQQVRHLLADCKRADARDENMNVMGIPEWRGTPVAEAIYQLGEIEEQAGLLLKAHNYYQRVYLQYKGVGGGRWGAMGYLAAARCLETKAADPKLLSREKAYYQEGRLRTLQAMLVDVYTNTEQNQDLIEQAKEMLGQKEALSIQTLIDSGTETNFTVNIEASMEDDGANGSTRGDS